MVAQMTSLKRSIKSFVWDAFYKYKGNKQVEFKAFSKADIGIMAFMGNDIAVKLKSPEINFLPIKLIIFLATFLTNPTNFSF